LALSEFDNPIYQLSNENIIMELKDLVPLIDAQGEAFEKFKKSNDDRFKALDKEFTEFAKKANRPGMGNYTGSRDVEESKSQLAAYIRSRGETKGMFSASGPDGGWTVIPVLADSIGTMVRDSSALRQLVNFIEIGAGDSYEELISSTAAGASWVGEQESRPETDSPTLTQVTTSLHELYAMPVLSQRLADDSSYAMVDFLTSETGISFSEAEETALFSGLGVKSPRGIATYPTAATADATRAFGTFEHIPTGVSGGLHATLPLDAIKAMFFKLKAGYRTNAKWVMNSATALAISQSVDANLNYLWDQGDVVKGQPTMLLGKEVIITEAAPAIAANSLSVWFGDWNQALRGIERPGNKILLDPFTDKPNLRVYVYRRMGLQVRNFNALKCLKFSTT
jgi:HK97 family phage major capsid protein